jgi:hypothetical protein
VKLYTVVWHQQTLAKLAQFWLAAPDRGAVQLAADSIDVELAKRPLVCGESIAEDTREVSCPPLAVLYSVRDADRIVEVIGVRLL